MNSQDYTNLADKEQKGMEGTEHQIEKMQAQMSQFQGQIDNHMKNLGTNPDEASQQRADQQIESLKNDIQRLQSEIHSYQSKLTQEQHEAQTLRQKASDAAKQEQKEAEEEARKVAEEEAKKQDLAKDAVETAMKSRNDGFF